MNGRKLLLALAVPAILAFVGQAVLTWRSQSALEADLTLLRDEVIRVESLAARAHAIGEGHKRRFAKEFEYASPRITRALKGVDALVTELRTLRARLRALERR